MQAPGQEEPCVFGIDMREAAVMDHVVVVEGERGESRFHMIVNASPRAWRHEGQIQRPLARGNRLRGATRPAFVAIDAPLQGETIGSITRRMLAAKSAVVQVHPLVAAQYGCLPSGAVVSVREAATDGGTGRARCIETCHAQRGVYPVGVDWGQDYAGAGPDEEAQPGVTM